MGTPAFAGPTLLELLGAGHELAAAYTRAPAPAGRGLELKPSPVQAAAAARGIEVRHPANFRDPAEVERLAALGAEAAVVVAYGLILPRAVLDLFPLGCLNLHASLLPRWRGAAPIQRAVMAGDSETGVCVMRMEAGLDTGPVGLAERVAIGPEDTSGDLHDRLSVLGADLMVRALAAHGRGSLGFTPQPATGATYASKIGNDEARVDWARPAAALHDLVRGLSPFPGAFAEADLGRGPERVKLLRTGLAAGSGAAGKVLSVDPLVVACGEGALRLDRVRRAGKGETSGAEFARGARLEAGRRFGA